MNIQLLDKKIAIFESTLSLVYKHGFHGTPMSQIAAEANVATGTIYHYFSSKEELIIELFIYCREKTNEYIFFKDEESGYKERFAYIWNRLIDYYINNKEIFWFVEQFYSSPFYQLICNKKSPSYYGVDKMKLFFEEGIKSKTIRKINFYTLVSIYIGTATSHVRLVTFGFNTSCKNNREELLEIIWNAVKNQ